jgi:hypothetical protein
MENHIFLKPKLTGGRFENHSIPLDFLADIAALQEIIIDIAKSEFKKQNPDKKRIPTNFIDGISLGLSKIETGSVIPVISLIFAPTTLFLDHPSIPYFEQARDTLINTITHLESNDTIYNYIPTSTIKLFDHFGSKLKDGEAVELSYPNAKSSAKYTKQIRERILTQCPHETTSQKISHRGYVIEIDRAKMTWTFLTIDKTKMTAPINPSIEKDIHKALKEYTPNSHNNTRILIEGNVETNPSGIHQITTINNIEILDPLDVNARLEELKLLKTGWLDGRQGEPLDPQGLAWLSGMLGQFCHKTTQLPCLYPTPNGNIQAEWSFNKFNILLEINIKQQNGICQIMDMSKGVNSENDQELFFNFEHNKEWEKLFDTVQKYQNQ